MKRILFVLLAVGLVAGCSGEIEADEKKENPPASATKESEDPEDVLGSKKVESIYLESLDREMEKTFAAVALSTEYDSEDPEGLTQEICEKLAAPTLAIQFLNPPQHLRDKHKEIHDHLMSANKGFISASSFFHGGMKAEGYQKAKEAIQEAGKAKDIYFELDR